MEDIKKALPGVKEGVSMAEYTTFKIGGKAKYFITVQTPEDLLKSVKAAKKFKLSFFIMCGGSNLLVSDRGYNGLIIKMDNNQVDVGGEIITAGAGAPLKAIVKLATDRCLTGLEWAEGIPGSLGGAVYGNVGAFGSTMAGNVKSVKVLDARKLAIKDIPAKACGFNNKDSIFKSNKDLIILSASLKVKPGNKEEIEKEVKRFSDYRKTNHPLDFPSAGCIFKNYAKKVTNKELLKKYPELNEFNKGSRIPTSYLIDKAGAKGKVVGGAQVSEKHANFIVNIGGAKANDVLKLIKVIKQKVKSKFKISLEEEVQYLK